MSVAEEGEPQFTQTLSCKTMPVTFYWQGVHHWVLHPTHTKQSEGTEIQGKAENQANTSKPESTDTGDKERQAFERQAQKTAS